MYLHRTRRSPGLHLGCKPNPRLQEFSSAGTFIRAFGYGVSDGTDRGGEKQDRDSGRLILTTFEEPCSLAVLARRQRSWIMMTIVVVYASAVGGCGSDRSTGSRSQAPGSAQVVTARMYGTQVRTVCERYNAEIAQIGRKTRKSREHEVQLTRATNAVTASEASALIQIPRPPGFGQLERQYREMALAANLADESTRLFSTGQLGRANVASLSASRELGVVNEAFRRLGLSICAE